MAAPDVAVRQRVRRALADCGKTVEGGGGREMGGAGVLETEGGRGGFVGVVDIAGGFGVLVGRAVLCVSGDLLMPGTITMSMT
jgi:hypothetical protein